ncbi:sensor domain-containing protein [Mycobacterium sp. E1715]|uniref:sensor domain-containing protein n=1 Tax=Mycobacterium sp. E1715 TaxID=1856863 RepID=UPI000A591030|nr:sensor domain-containing protein [Mycobacterium sp. E1715]
MPSSPHPPMARTTPPSPGEEVTAVLPRRPFRTAGAPPMPPMPPRMPAWGTPPGYPPAFVPAPSRRWPTWAQIAVGAAVMVTLGAAGLAINVAASPDDTASSTVLPAPKTSAAPVSPGPAPEAPTVPLSALPGLLLDVATINSIEGATDIAPAPDSGNDHTAYSGLTTDRPECGEIQAPALESELDGSGWIGVRTQSLQDRDGARHLNHSAAVYFGTAKAANDFAAKQAQAWPRCNGASLHLTTRREPTSVWTAGTATNRDGMLSITNTQEGAGGWQCQRALAARNNIVIDVRNCGENRTDQAITIATRMAERVTTG